LQEPVSPLQGLVFVEVSAMKSTTTTNLLPAVLLVAIGLLAFGSGCGQAVFRSPLPADLVEKAEIPGMPRVRYWGDSVDPQLQAEFVRVAREFPVLPDHLSEQGPGFGGLVLSGGGDCGAYGAGVLCGWTERGTRPRFRIVTGVSTGALIAPMAFLGPKYDQLLRDSYTKVSAKDVLRTRPFLDWLKFDSMADNTPLMNMMEKQFPDEFIREVAVEHAKGRRMFVQTVNLDAQRPVIWDMGAIASSNHPDAPKLFRKVLVASASIPAVFPPQYIKVQANGKTYDEMHVDGGTSSQMLMSTLPVNLSGVRKELGPAADTRFVYVIRNATIRPEWQQMTPKLFPIAGRAVSSMIKSQGRTELELMYYEAKEAGIDFYLTYIPNDYKRETNEEFDNTEMNRMFNVGYELARNGDPWKRTPPKLETAIPAANPASGR
jgi:predicted patatin/cPLA2 family phospholipase